MTKVDRAQHDHPGAAHRDLFSRRRTTSRRWTSWCCRASGNGPPTTGCSAGSGSEHPPGAPGRAPGRGDLRHRRQRHPQRLRPRQGHRRPAARSPSARAATWTAAEVERMVAEAERNRSADARLRQEVDARNELDAVAYQVERRLDRARRGRPRPRAGPGGAAGRRRPPGHPGAGADRSAAGAHRRAPAAAQGLQAAARARGGPGPGGPRPRGPTPSAARRDDVIDAELHPPAREATMAAQSARAPGRATAGRRYRTSRREPARPGRTGGGRARAPPGPSSRTAGGVRWPISTTSASATPASWTGSGPPSGPGWPPSGCPWSTPRPGPGPRRPTAPTRARSWRGSGPCATRRWPCSPGSATPATTTSGCPSTRCRHEAVGGRSTPRRRPGHGGGRAAARLRREEERTGCVPRPWPWPPAGGVRPWPATTTRSSGSRARQRRRRSSSLPAAGPELPPGRQQGPGRRGALQGGQRGLPGAVRSRHAGPATTASATTSGRCRRTWAEREARAGLRRPGPRGPGRVAPGVRGRRGQAIYVGTRYGDFGEEGGAGSTSTTCSAACSAGGAGRPVPGADQEAELELTVEEAYSGGRRWVSLAGPEGPRSYEVTIPPGVVDGQRIRLAGQGGRGGGWRPRPATST